MSQDLNYPVIYALLPTQEEYADNAKVKNSAAKIKSFCDDENISDTTLVLYAQKNISLAVLILNNSHIFKLKPLQEKIIYDQHAADGIFTGMMLNTHHELKFLNKDSATDFLKKSFNIETTNINDIKRFITEQWFTSKELSDIAKENFHFAKFILTTEYKNKFNQEEKLAFISEHKKHPDHKRLIDINNRLSNVMREQKTSPTKALSNDKIRNNKEAKQSETTKGDKLTVKVKKFIQKQKASKVNKGGY